MVMEKGVWGSKTHSRNRCEYASRLRFHTALALSLGLLVLASGPAWAQTGAEARKRSPSERARAVCNRNRLA